MVVERYQAKVFRIARGLTRDVHQAEDVLQDTFLSALRGAASYRGDAAVSSWLYAIARHAAYRLGRRTAEVAVDEASLERLGIEAGLGVSGEAAAATLECTLPAMKSRLHRARLRLAGLLRGTGGERAAR